MEQQFTAPQDFDLWPQAHLHTQWPGSGLQGDPTFDNFSLAAGGLVRSRLAEQLACCN
jgi:hypothetical protein